MLERFLNAIQQVFNLLFRKRVSAEEFGKSVFLFLKKQIVEKEIVRKDLEIIDSLLSATEFIGDWEKNFAQLYLRLEQFISQEQLKNRISKDTLRGMVVRFCHADRADGDFALLFLPEYLRKIKLFEQFAEILLKRARYSLSQEKYSAVIDILAKENYLKGIIKDGNVDWLLFEQKMEGAMLDPEKREEIIRELLSQMLQRLFRNLSEAVEAIRAELAFKESYHQFRDRLNFLDDVSQALLIAPGEILQEERVEIMSKPKLAEEVRRRNQELEVALAQLSEEKRRVDEEKRKLAAALEDLKIADRAKSDFITVVSHQFRTPLSAIRWNSEIITDEVEEITPEEKKAKMLPYIQSIQEKSVFVINILDDIYDVLGIEGRTAVVDRKPSQLWEIMVDVLNNFEKQAKSKKVELAFDRAAAPVKEISLDQQKIRRVCTILIRNAIQYTPENGKVAVKIWEAEYQGRPVLASSIQDTGIGVAPEDIKNLFTKFFRGKNAVKMVADGAGLGLYLVKNFIEVHGGAIFVESELAKGSTFTFTLPLQ